MGLFVCSSCHDSAMNPTYQNSDYRSLELHKLIAAKLKENPRLVNTALENIERWKMKNNFPQPYLDDWLNIINHGLEPLLDFLASETEEAARLRSSSPFTGILTQEERNDIFRLFGAITKQ